MADGQVFRLATFIRPVANGRMPCDKALLRLAWDTPTPVMKFRQSHRDRLLNVLFILI